MLFCHFVHLQNPLCQFLNIFLWCVCVLCVLCVCMCVLVLKFHALLFFPCITLLCQLLQSLCPVSPRGWVMSPWVICVMACLTNTPADSSASLGCHGNWSAANPSRMSGWLIRGSCCHGSGNSTLLLYLVITVLWWLPPISIHMRCH